MALFSQPFSFTRFGRELRGLGQGIGEQFAAEPARRFSNLILANQLKQQQEQFNFMQKFYDAQTKALEAQAKLLGRQTQQKDQVSPARERVREEGRAGRTPRAEVGERQPVLAQPTPAAPAYGAPVVSEDVFGLPEIEDPYASRGLFSEEAGPPILQFLRPVQAEQQRLEQLKRNQMLDLLRRAKPFQRYPQQAVPTERRMPFYPGVMGGTMGQLYDPTTYPFA